jgi:hypothetical protein
VPADVASAAPDNPGTCNVPLLNTQRFIVFLIYAKLVKYPGYLPHPPTGFIQLRRGARQPSEKKCNSMKDIATDCVLCFRNKKDRFFVFRSRGLQKMPVGAGRADLFEIHIEMFGIVTENSQYAVNDVQFGV